MTPGVDAMSILSWAVPTQHHPTALKVLVILAVCVWILGYVLVRQLRPAGFGNESPNAGDSKRRYRRYALTVGSLMFFNGLVVVVLGMAGASQPVPWVAAGVLAILFGAYFLSVGKSMKG